MPNFLEFAEQKLREREPIYSWGEEKFSEEEMASKSKTPDPSEVRLDLFEVTKILQNDLDRQIISLDSGLREYYDFYKALDDDKASYQQQYVGAGKGDKQNKLRNKTREFFEQIKARYPENIAAIRLLEEDLTKKIDANIDVQVAMAVPYLMLQTITYFDQIDKIQDGEKKRHFLSQFPMSTREEYACVGGFSARLNPILMMLNAENVHLNSAHQSAVSSSNLNRGDSVHQQAMMNALFGINLKDEHYLLPAGRFTAQELWQGYLDYHAKLQEQFLLQQEQVKQDVIGLAKLFDESNRGDFSKELKEKFSLKDADFYEYDEDFMVIGINDKKVEAELERRLENYYPRGIDLPNILQGGAAEIKDFNAHKTSEVIRNILHNGELSQSEKNVALNYLWIRAVKEINDSNTKSVLSKFTEEDLLQLLIENKTDEEIKSFFEQKEQQSLATLEQIASFDNSILSQDKLVLIKYKLVFEKVLCKQDLLLFTARNDYIEALQALLKDDQIDVNRATQNGLTALMIAAYGHLEVVTKLLEVAGIDVNHAAQNGDTALIIAAQNGHSEVVAKLLGVEGINVNHATQNGLTALMIAAQKGHLEVVAKLLEVAGIDVNKNNQNGDTALIIAAQNGHSEVVAKLLGVEGINVNHATQDGLTALMIAAQKGHLEVVAKLLEVAGIDVNKNNQNGDTALMIAAQDGHLEVVTKLLATEGIDVNQATQNGVTALMFAAQKGHLEVVTKLLEVGGIEANRATQNGFTALMIAAYNGHLEVVAKLLGVTGINVNHAARDGFTALMIAAQNGHSEIVAKLLGVTGIDVNHATQNGFTALMIAAQNGRSEVVTKLLDAEGIDINRAKQDGFTALKIAALNGRSEMVGKIFKKLCMDGTDPRDIAYIQADRPKIFSDADKISSFADKIFSFIIPFWFIKSEFGFSATGEKKLKTLVRKSLFREIFADENMQNVDPIINHFAQEGAVENIANTIAARLQSFDGAIKPSKSRLALIPFNNPKTLNLEHEGIEALVRDPIKELINQALAPDPSSVYGRSGVSLKSTERGDGGVNRI